LFGFRHLTYDLIDKLIDLPLESEEVAGFYGAMLETDYAKNATFNKNFLDDWSKILKKHPPVLFCYNVIDAP
jgi:DNA topoisomerase I